MEKIFGIDVSDWQGNIDWEKVKAAGVKFALLKCGYGMDLTDQDDACFVQNASECERLGIPYGVYLYSYANTMEKAKSEAAHVLRMLKGRKPRYPVYLDLEDQITLSVSKEQILAQVKAWCEIIEGAGYKAGIYANLYWWDTYLTDPWYDTKERWVAQYYTQCEYAKDYGIWQYTSRGSVDGVNGNVDCDWCYKDYLTTEPEVPDMPPEAPSETVYVVKYGDTLSGIANEYSTTYQALAAYNGIANPNLIHVGDKIRIPGTAEAPAKSIEDLAREVIHGKWGNGGDRRTRLHNAGYDYAAVQSRVNEMLK